MLYWYFRNFQCVIYGLFGGKIHVNALVKRNFICNIFDTDWFRGMQSSGFFTYTDAGRWEIAMRAGFFRQALKNKWVIVLGGQKIIYRRPVRFLKKFTLEMQLTGFNDKWMYVAQTFRQDGDVKCVVLTKIGIRAQGKLFSPRKVCEILGFHDVPQPPAYILHEFENDLEIYDVLKNSL